MLGEVHSQVEACIKTAAGRTHSENPKESNLELVKTLSPTEIATIASQARHDILCEQDKAWVKPDDLPAIARAITRLRREDGTAFTDGEACRIERTMDRRVVATMLQTGRRSPL